MGLYWGIFGSRAMLWVEAIETLKRCTSRCPLICAEVDCAQVMKSRGVLTLANQPLQASMLEELTSSMGVNDIAVMTSFMG